MEFNQKMWRLAKKKIFFFKFSKNSNHGLPISSRVFTHITWSAAAQRRVRIHERTQAILHLDFRLKYAKLNLWTKLRQTVYKNL